MRNLLEIEIGDVWVEGEISNLRRQASGHCYFTLKDEGAQISCVLFRGTAGRAKAQPEDGMQARLFGEISVYEARGQVQLIVKQLEDAGMGDLQAQFEKLKRKLNAEGLFDPSIKKALPKFPQKIGLITSPTGAVLQDILNVLSRRAPWVQPVLYPVRVQGKGEEQEIATAIERLGEAEKHGFPVVDTIIVGRGGGSLEDLWNFNEEVVARAIHACPVPIISAVGHEIDFTIADFTADVRAPTPSAAAELAVLDAEELRAKVGQHSVAMKRIVESHIKHDMAILTSARRALMPRDSERALRDPILELDRVREGLSEAVRMNIRNRQTQIREVEIQHAAHHPKRVLARRAERLELAQNAWQRAGENALQHARERFQNLASLVKTLGPEATFTRGFSITMDANGKPVTDADQVKKDERLVSKFAKGEVVSIVDSISSKK